MQKLQRADLLSLEDYSERRAEIRERVIQHKKARRLILGPHASLHFEDRETMRYQIQEMLRVERIFNREEIQEEIDTYNELVPDGSNWKATLLFEYADVDERARELTKLVGIEHTIFVRINNEPAATVHANDDMPRSNDSKTAAVHFLRFEFSTSEIAAIARGDPVTIGFDHAALPYQVTLGAELHASLVQDFDT